jgi:lipopolysaccharide export system permease protein
MPLVRAKLTKQHSPLSKGRLPWLLDRYIFAAMLAPFLFGVGIFSTIAIAVGVVFDLVSQLSDMQIPPGLLLQILVLQAPYFIGFAFPMALLLAALLTFSRLSADSEVTALRSVGVSVFRLIVPVLIFGGLVSLLTFSFNETLVPQSRYQASRLLEQTLQQGRTTLQAQNLFYPEYGPDQEIKRLFYARQYDGERMHGLTILDFSQPGVDQVITASSARWNPKASVWTFMDGTVYLVSADGSYRSVLEFTEQQIKIPRDAIKAKLPDRNPSEMTLLEAQQALKILRRGDDQKAIRKLEVQIQQRYAIPLQGLMVGLIGAGIALQPQRDRSARGFGISIAVIFGYYLLSTITQELGNSGVLTPLIAAWSPSGLGLASAGWLLLRANR